ncbi:MAG: hypothetical protein KF770_22715 [Anaerolineae bacterium]|nr:hypothetical protein [Anaerolineae bacterium]
MTQTVTLQLPNRVASTARSLAQQTKRPIEDILVEWLDHAVADLPISSLNDEQVLALTKLQLDQQQQKQLSELLAKNREGTLAPPEMQQLNELMQVYRHGLVRKAEALKVAVERGLVSPLS